MRIESFLIRAALVIASSGYGPDASGEMEDTGWVAVTGVSNNNLRWGPPEYEKARFRVSAGTTRIRVVLGY